MDFEKYFEKETLVKGKQKIVEKIMIDNHQVKAIVDGYHVEIGFDLNGQIEYMDCECEHHLCQHMVAVLQAYSQLPMEQQFEEKSFNEDDFIHQLNEQQAKNFIKRIIKNNISLQAQLAKYVKEDINVDWQLQQAKQKYANPQGMIYSFYKVDYIKVLKNILDHDCVDLIKQGQLNQALTLVQTLTKENIELACLKNEDANFCLSMAELIPYLYQQASEELRLHIGQWTSDILDLEISENMEKTFVFFTLKYNFKINVLKNILHILSLGQYQKNDYYNQLAMTAFQMMNDQQERYDFCDQYFYLDGLKQYCFNNQEEETFYHKRIERYKAILAKDDARPFVHHCLAHIYYEMNNIQGFIYHQKKCIQYDPKEDYYREAKELLAKEDFAQFHH